MKYYRRVRGKWLLRRSPQGERGLKFRVDAAGLVADGGRSPQGERGLKLRYLVNGQGVIDVAPRKGSAD